MAGRLVGRVLTTTLGWASTLLFGRVSAAHQRILAAMTFGSVVWMAVLVGVILGGPARLIGLALFGVALLVGGIGRRHRAPTAATDDGVAEA